MIKNPNLSSRAFPASLRVPCQILVLIQHGRTCGAGVAEHAESAITVRVRHALYVRTCMYYVDVFWRSLLRGDLVMPVVKEDCDWVVGRYRSHLLHNDRSAAKAWILTARSLFPDNFEVQVV